MHKIRNIIIIIILVFVLVTFSFVIKIYLQPIAIVAPHHNIVKEKRLEFFKIIAQKRITTKSIILIGPNHFYKNQKSIYYSNNDWNLSQGNIQFEKRFETKLSPYLSLQNGIVKNDHAIINLLPDIKKIWPDAKIFPILIGQNYSTDKLDNFICQIKQLCQSDCLLVVSVDFSHYLPATLANIHDTKSIYDLSIQNLTEISKLEVDSPQSLFIFSKFAKIKNAKKWNLFYHSNSGEISNDRDVESTSHVLGHYSRSLFYPKIPEVKTFILTNNIDSKLSIASLGARFFYGTDYTDSSIPVDLSYISPKDFVIAGWKTPTNSQLIFLPTETHGGITSLLKGEKKDIRLKELFEKTKFNFQYKLDSKNGVISF